MSFYFIDFIYWVKIKGTGLEKRNKKLDSIPDIPGKILDVAILDFCDL